MQEIYPLVYQLTIPEQAENALVELSKKREDYPDLAPVLWYSYGVMAALLQELIAIYPMLSPPTLTANASNRVCNALALLQCVASHSETKSKLMNASIQFYLYPFLNTSSKQRPFEYLRLTSLGVIGALVKVDDSEVVNFLLQTEIFPLCLRIMSSGSELSKTVATFIVQKILLHDAGLSYVCASSERFYMLTTVLGSMISKQIEPSTVRLLKHVVRCYLRLSDNPKAREALRSCLPEILRDPSFAANLPNEDSVQKWLNALLKNIGDSSGSSGTSGGGVASGSGGGTGSSAGGGTTVSGMSPALASSNYPPLPPNNNSGISPPGPGSSQQFTRGNSSGTLHGGAW